MSPEYANQMTAGLLLASLISVLSLGVLLTLIVMWVLTRRRALAAMAQRDSGLGTNRSEMEAAERIRWGVVETPAAWLAIRSTNMQAVQEALGLHNPKPWTWSDGVSGLSGQTLVIAPPVDGWLLVAGPGLPDPEQDIDHCFRFITDLSRELGRVQFFWVNRALNHHAWVRAENGAIQRAYAWAGTTLWNQGVMTRAEKDLQLRCYDYFEPPEGVPYGTASHYGNADKIFFLAARWSIDPSTIGTRVAGLGGGLAGDADR